ncbi:MAG: adenosylcobinamide-phosphate synthase CbiB [Rhodobacteraceae bacterium]|nr:adenosylcobinamide-phosphate synthase CbiB [Paracoccaceae bacterium]
MIDPFLVVFLALLIDAAVGEPDALWGKVPHPVKLMGSLVKKCDIQLNHGDHRRLKGAFALAACCALMILIGLALEWISIYGIVDVAVVAVLLCQKSLVEHARIVASGLRLSLEEGRRAVSHIVGRDVSKLDHSGVVRAAVESVAENFSDGIVAPVFWYLVLGLPGILVYKLVNTADSMVGYRNSKYSEFGWSFARLDDLANWIPARISAVLIKLWGQPYSGWRDIRRDAAGHRSPNAGWPEAAMASVLGISLSGPRSYDGSARQYPYINDDGRKAIGVAYLDSAISLVRKASAGLAGVVLLLSFVA